MSNIFKNKQFSTVLRSLDNYTLYEGQFKRMLKLSEQTLAASVLSIFELRREAKIIP